MIRKNCRNPREPRTGDWMNQNVGRLDFHKATESIPADFVLHYPEWQCDGDFSS